MKIKNTKTFTISNKDCMKKFTKLKSDIDNLCHLSQLLQRNMLPIWWYSRWDLAGAPPTRVGVQPEWHQPIFDLKLRRCGSL